ncbi:MAG: metal-dependent hydrolase [Magnetococcales bacterium]|nr:metal-dependent hydrolase [Magnetococcales bacterium]
MASPIAHACLGVISLATITPLKCWTRKQSVFWWIMLFAILGCLPDIDYIFGLALTGNMKTFHFKETHSLLFASILALILSTIWQRHGHQKVWFMGLSAFIAIASHVLSDWFTGPSFGLHPSWGINAFWPLTSSPIQMPVTIFPGIKFKNFSGIFDFVNLKTVMVEFVIFIPISAWLVWWRLRQPGSLLHMNESKQTTYTKSDQ